MLSSPANLRFGVPGSQMPARDPAAAARRAEEAGFDSMWWADRLMGWMPDGPHALLDPFPLMAVAGVATTRLLLGTAVADPSRRHPAQLAQTALSVQNLSNGRLLLGLGCGEVAGTRPYGIRYEKPVAHLEEAITVLHELWRDGRPANFEGRFYQLNDALCGLAAVTPSPPIWVAAHGPRTIGLTGKVADGWLPTAGGVPAYAVQLAQLREAERGAGRSEGAVEAGAFIWLVAAESKERARQLFRNRGLRALGLLLPQGTLAHTPLPDGPWAGLNPTDPHVFDLVDQIDPDELAEVIPHGSPEDVAKEVARYAAAGAQHLVLCDMSATSGEDNGLDLRPLDTHVAVREAVRFGSVDDSA
jgi:phthiodiolone/phenolphthiodiolone dimycocerosates ketoreductase